MKKTAQLLLGVSVCTGAAWHKLNRSLDRRCPAVCSFQTAVSQNWWGNTVFFVSLPHNDEVEPKWCSQVSQLGSRQQTAHSSAGLRGARGRGCLPGCRWVKRNKGWCNTPRPATVRALTLQAKAKRKDVLSECRGRTCRSEREPPHRRCVFRRGVPSSWWPCREQAGRNEDLASSSPLCIS